jgi:F0F1-type ATP synthase assembly protein I
VGEEPEPDEAEKSPEEEEAERLAEQEQELLDRLSVAASRQLPEVPEWEFKRPEHRNGQRSISMATGRAFGLMISILYALIGPTVVGLLVGYIADSRLGTQPLWTAIGFLLGAVAGLAMLIRLVMGLSEEEK